MEKLCPKHRRQMHSPDMYGPRFDNADCEACEELDIDNRLETAGFHVEK